MKTDILAGMRQSLSVIVSAAPFGLLFGALAVDNGMTVWQAVLMSATVYAGASQMVGIELFGQNVAPWLIVFSIFAVNFRHVLYSASIGRRFGGYNLWQKALAFFLLIDPQFAESERRIEQGKPLTLAWYLAFGLPIYVVWIAEAWLGATFGKMISNPQALGLDFLLPIYFLGLVMGFRKRTLWLPVVLASGAASMLAWKLVGSPWHVSLGALAGIALAAAAPLPKPATGTEAMK
ncbi:MAG: AzlC family ABC transporter permease [Nitratireductor sp.]